MKGRMFHGCVALVLCVPLLCGGDCAWAAQQAKGVPLGSLTARGEVYINQLRISGEVTVFSGDTLRTGADGVADLTVVKQGVLNITPQSQISFEQTPRYFASLDHGTVGLRALQDAENFQIRIGRYVIVPVPGAEAAVAIERSSDGSSQLRCLSGSVGVFALEAEESVFVHVGEELKIPANGPLPASAVAIATPQGTAPVPAAKKKSAKPFIILGVVGGAAGAAAAALTRGGPGQPVSPSHP